MVLSCTGNVILFQEPKSPALHVWLATEFNADATYLRSVLHRWLLMSTHLLDGVIIARLVEATDELNTELPVEMPVLSDEDGPKQAIEVFHIVCISKSRNYAPIANPFATIACSYSTVKRC